MTTPRVTVPVEDWKRVIGALKNAQARLGPGAAVCNVSAALAKVEHLSAAPAPEGGAWSLDDMRELVSDEQVRHLVSATDVAQGRARLRDILNALATREEAPAEAGEREAIARAVRRAVGDAWIGEHQAEVAADAVLALRVQPPAREDALRVAVEALAEVSSLTDKDVSAKGLLGAVELLVEIQTTARQALAALQAEQGAK